MDEGKVARLAKSMELDCELLDVYRVKLKLKEGEGSAILP